MPFPPYSIEHQKKLVPPVIPGEAAFVRSGETLRPS